MVVNNYEQLTLVGMEELPGSVGTLEQTVVHRQEELLAGKWAQQRLYMVMDSMAWAISVVDTPKAVVASFGEVFLYQHKQH